MQVNSEKFDDQQIVKKIMQSLSAKFDYVVVRIEEGNDIFTLIVEGLMSSLCSYEQKINHRINSNNFKQVLQSRTSTRGHSGQQDGRDYGSGNG